MNENENKEKDEAKLAAMKKLVDESLKFIGDIARKNKVEPEYFKFLSNMVDGLHPCFYVMDHYSMNSQGKKESKCIHCGYVSNGMKDAFRKCDNQERK